MFFLLNNVNSLLYPIMNMTLNMNNGRARFFQIQDRNTQANLCKNIYPETIEKDNEATAMRIVLVRQKWNQQLHQI